MWDNIQDIDKKRIYGELNISTEESTKNEWGMIPRLLESWFIIVSWPTKSNYKLITFLNII